MTDSPDDQVRQEEQVQPDQTTAVETPEAKPQPAEAMAEAEPPPIEAQVRQRRFPAPFKAMLAISNDIDLTNIHRLRALHRFVNSTAETPMGRGLGLDFGDSMWMYRRPPLEQATPRRFPHELAYWEDYQGRARTAHAEELLAYARCGWIDTLHTYGNFTGGRAAGFRFYREHAERALAELHRRDVQISVWTNHGARDNRQNIGEPDFMEGDDPQSEAYHADLLLDYGVRFLWRQLDQSVPGKPVAAEPLPLADGAQAYGFTRYQTVMDDTALARRAKAMGLRAGRNVSGRAYAMLWTARAIDEQLSAETLDRVVEEGAFLVAGQHLGDQGSMAVLDDQGVRAFRRLRDYQDRGLILTARVSRLLRYDVNSRGARWTVEASDDGPVINIHSIEDAIDGAQRPTLEKVRGLTFCVPDSRKARLAVAGRALPEAQVLRMSLDGEETIGVRWHAADTADHAAAFFDRPTQAQVPGGPIGEDRTAALARMNEAALSWLGERQAAASDRGDDDAAAVVNFAIRRYERGLPHYGGVMERLGFVDRRRGLDVGCGVGHWVHAFAALNREADGVEMRPEYVDLANGVAARIGLDQTARCHVGDARRLQFHADTFDVAWCHGALMFIEHDLMLAEMNRVVETGGALYLGYTSPGHRLHSIETAIADTAGHGRAAAQVSILYGAELYRQGVYRTPRGRVRCYTREELQNVVRLCGFSPVAAPSQQDQRGLWHGFEGAIDLLAYKDADVASRVDGLLAACADDAAILAEAAAIVDCGAPEIAARLLECSDLDRESDAFVVAYETARLKAGQIARVEDLAPALADIEGPEAQLVRARAAVNFSRWPDALQALDGLAEDAPTLFLRGAATLEAGDADAATQIFEDCVGRWPSDLRSRIGLIRSRDAAGDKGSFAQYCTDLCDAAESLSVPNIELG